MTTILEMKNINKSFPGVKALDNAYFKLKKGTVHALMGENGAGKSTLMKVLFGIYSKDSGQVLIDGKEISFENPKDAMDHGVSMVHQELNQVMKRDVAENMMLGRLPKKHGFVDHKAMYAYCDQVLKDLGINIDPRTVTEDLSVAERQLIEIAKAVSYDAKILVLDEPTSSLTEQEVDILFKIINDLRERGVGIIYISHKMNEILRISDEVTVMRDGAYIATDDAKNLTTDKIIALMVGRNIDNVYPEKDNVPGSVMVEFKKLSGRYEPTFKDISFDLRKGEILGISGLVGARRTELVEAIFGYRTLAQGDIIKEGKKVDNSTPQKAIENGFALVTEERRQTGIFPLGSIVFNTVIANLKSYVDKGALKDSKMRQDTLLSIQRLKVKTPNERTEIRSLSGGNQQKVIFGRWLLTEPDVLLLDEPTRGIDVGAKYEIYQLMIELAKQGKSVIFISSEMPELLGVCDRILVMSDGKVAGIEEAKHLDQEKVMALSTKYL